ncbi:MAG: hypothetical protein U9N59_12575 [Campylobacterota bacterium]|nr:hypothetical protein [Campylobacterota bacterium]
MIKNNFLEGILEYTNEKGIALFNLMDALKLVWYINKNNPLLEDIIYKAKVDLELPLVFKKIDDIRSHTTHQENLIYPLRKKIKGLQLSPISWLYYALYFSLNLKENSIEDFVKNGRIIQVTNTILNYHYAYLNYKFETQKNKKKINHEFYKMSARTLTRTIEFLIKFEQSKNRYLLDIYFDKTEHNDVGINFLKLVTNVTSVESEYFLIKKDLKSGHNYMAYENTSRDIYIDIESSRTIKKGTQKENFERNNKISEYLEKGYEYYLKLLEIDLREKKMVQGDGYTRVQGSIQYTEEDELLKDTYIVKKETSLIMEIEDIHTIPTKLKLKKRAYPSNNLEASIPNIYKQKLRNRAFSAQITKKSMLLETDYKIPPKEIYRDFLNFSINDKLTSNLEIKEVYNVIFLIDAVTGLGYHRIIEIILERKKMISLDSNLISIKINQTLFAKNKNDYINKNEQKIFYKIPENLVFLINKIKEYYREFDETEQENFLNDDEATKYFNYIDSKIKSYPKRIKFDNKNMWRIIDSYRKNLYFEDMSTLFCMGRNQQSDTPKLAYSSANKMAQNHSRFLEKLYIDLDIHSITAHLLGFDKTLFKPKYEVSTSSKYTGSSQAVQVEESRKFFKNLKKMISVESNELKYFNLVAIYVRYALSLLIGTRPYADSASLSRLSLELHVLVISEKSDTLLAGIRTIPLCNEIVEIIVNYQNLCRDQNIPDDNIYLLEKDKVQKFKKNNAIELLNEYNASINIIEFLTYVPLNTGRHVITKMAMESNFNLFYLEAYMGHYTAGCEQQGIYSTLDMQDYITSIQQLTSSIAETYGVRSL